MVMTNLNFKSKCSITSFEKSDISETYIDWLNDPIVTKYSNQNYVTASLGSCAEYLDSFSGTDNLFYKIE
jgi:hypothetical protein